METFYFNLSGGINQSTTKTELGLNTKNIFWTEGENVEILLNRGIIRQKGNKLLTSLEGNQNISVLHEMKYSDRQRLIIATKQGHLYIYNPESNDILKLDKTINSQKPIFVDFLNGTIVCSKQDEMFFIKNNENYDIENCNLQNSLSENIYSDVVTVYKGRVWVASGSSIYFSALGRYNDFSSQNDAGYINDFYTDTDEIIALKAFNDYLAIYKKHKVYLLTGSNPKDFAIQPFGDKGAYSQNSIVNVNNKQYFFSSGIYTLEFGELNQIFLGKEISGNIKNEYSNFDRKRFNEILVLNYEDKNQVWYFIPYKKDLYYHTIWINDIVNHAWYKRVLPQNITTATIFGEEVITADAEGRIYQENIGQTFNGEPIKFVWKSPFLSIGSPTIRKTIDEFYFILDESYENNFNFSVFKNYDSENKDDNELIYSSNFENLVWENESSQFKLNDTWADEENDSLWAIDAETMYKAEITEANYSVQLCVEGFTKEQNCAIIGIEFKEIYNED